MQVGGIFRMCINSQNCEQHSLPATNLFLTSSFVFFQKYLTDIPDALTQ